MFLRAFLARLFWALAFFCFLVMGFFGSGLFCPYGFSILILFLIVKKNQAEGVCRFDGPTKLCCLKTCGAYVWVA
jgi:hypothetical protein